MKVLVHLFVTALVALSLSACGDTSEIGGNGGGGGADTDAAGTDDSAGGSDTNDDALACDDADGDGYGDGAGCLAEDCDDSDDSVNPGAEDVCGDGIDQDCSGDDAVCTSCEDEDQDGYGKGPACKGPDCDDSDPTRNAGASEICGDGIDQDCDGQDLACPASCEDADKDGYGEGTDCIGEDCDDGDSDVHPGATDVCGNGEDEDCNGADAECPPECEDGDKDGYGNGDDCIDTDCDDADRHVNPGATEICGNGKDDDCTGGDEACAVECIDNDQDGYGEGPGCKGADCNDFNEDINPDATEVCDDGKDQDCDGEDAECPAECTDGDEDGFGVGTDCTVKDCDDTDATKYPGAAEVCGNGKDEDCDGIDPACVTCTDTDGDQYGEGASCKGPDCNDNDPAVHPGATEVCGNGKDDDCAGGDEECPTDCVDKDGDGAGVGKDCAGAKDCDDTDATVHPAAAEVCGNGKDDDCTGGDETCPEKTCAADTDCPLEQLCDQSTEQCRFGKVWEWWAPTLYQDIDKDKVGYDLPTSVDFDGDAIVLNNGTNKDKAKPAVIYYSFVKTSTHWYLGYYLYYPWRWSSFGALGTQYESAVRGVLLVIEQNGSTYGKLVAMETTTEDTFHQYLPKGSLLGGSASSEGDVRFDASGHHPIVYAHTSDHDLYGDAYLWNNVSNWEVGGFPGGDGVVYSWGNLAGTPKTGDKKTWYELKAVNDALWPKRFDTGGGTKMFSTFGQWSSNDPHPRSLAPWRMNDVNTPTRPAGEFLFSPADLVRSHFSTGWGKFSYEYVYNPYALRVAIDDLFITADAVTADPFSGLADPFFTLYLRDGAGKQFKALDIFYGLQNNWNGKDIPFADYPLDMHAELGRYFFYGLEHPSFDLFAVDLKDDDGGVSGADWLMDPGKTHSYSVTGTQLLDWKVADAYFTITKP